MLAQEVTPKLPIHFQAAEQKALVRQAARTTGESMSSFARRVVLAEARRVVAEAKSEK